MNRYNNRSIIKNSSKKYKDYFEKRGVNFINHYTSAKLKYPTEDEMSRILMVTHIWTVGDRYWKLANQFYKSPKYWWIIAWFNKKPTEGYVSAGDVLYIPTSLQQILELFDV